MANLTLHPDWSAPGQPFRHTWEEIINVDQFRWLARHDMLKQLERVRTELGGRHVRAVGMFDDEMRVLCPGPETFGGAEPRPVRTNWQMVDLVCDGLLERKLSPMITTSFVPSRLASGSTTVFTTRGHTSPPRNYAEWGGLVAEAARHFVERYGLEVVRGWWFEVWNEPNLAGWFWGADQAEFWKLWNATWRAIKSVDTELRVGGPSTARAEWLEAFLEMSAHEATLPDYLTLHIYNNDGEAGALAPFAGPQEDKLGTSPNLAAGVVRGARRMAGQAGFKGPIHFNEWGRSWRPVEPDRETANEAAFIVRAMAEFSQDADQFAYWCVSDIYDQVGFGRETFHGNYGLLNLQGLRKPAYHAFTLLHRLGDVRLPLRGEGIDTSCGAIATRLPNEALVLAYAYRHEEDAEARPLQVSVNLPKRAGDRCELFRVDSVENNVLTRWRELGAPIYLRPELRDALIAVDALKPSSSGVRVDHSDGRGTAWFAMESPGIALLRIPLEGEEV